MLEAVTTQRLYNLILEIISMLELELAELKNGNYKTRSNKKSITETLHKLVCLLIQLSKLKSDKSDEVDNPDELCTDQEIIRQFLKNHHLPKA